ncbi:YkyB family protein [Sporosarcina sp. HYO08]|uniref:YkyB family protein n=1 Tax=Sporosarcina sp. HYO08 TaxID=1759557 RepID=UPI0009E67D71|nr:YkyB family protein [Sporosarcina sp. HYO08]
MEGNHNIRQLAIAIYTVNRHAKTALDNRSLYSLKKMALDKLIQMGHAEKIGLHFVDNPKFSKQHSTVLVRCSDFLFHSIPDRNDFTTLPHLGKQDHSIRNPHERMNLKMARELLTNFIHPTTSIIPKQKRRIAAPRKGKVRSLQHTQRFSSSYLDGK